MKKILFGLPLFMLLQVGLVGSAQASETDKVDVDLMSIDETGNLLEEEGIWLDEDFSFENEDLFRGNRGGRGGRHGGGRHGGGRGGWRGGHGRHGGHGGWRGGHGGGRGGWGNRDWHCVAKNSWGGRHHGYGNNRRQARRSAMRQCNSYSFFSNCYISHCR